MIADTGTVAKISLQRPNPEPNGRVNWTEVRPGEIPVSRVWHWARITPGGELEGLGQAGECDGPGGKNHVDLDGETTEDDTE